MCATAHGFFMNTQDNRAAVAGDGSAPRTGDPGLNGSTETVANGSGYNFPNSKRTYVGAELHRDVRVPFREISLAPTKSMNGETEVNEPVRVYDTSGPWGDPDFHGDVTQGLPALRAEWIRARSDVEEYEGRLVRPIDDGYLSEVHAFSQQKRRTSNAQRPMPNGNGSDEKLSTLNPQPSTLPRRKPLRASANHPVTQLWYARQGIITPEMEFIAIRENGHTLA